MSELEAVIANEKAIEEEKRTAKNTEYWYQLIRHRFYDIDECL